MLMKDQHALLIESAFQSETVSNIYNLKFHFPVKVNSVSFLRLVCLKTEHHQQS